MKKNFIAIFIICAICIMIFALCIKKIGREQTLSWAMNVLSPICIILFYLSGVSIIVPILGNFQATDHTVLTNESIRVAVDSAIVSLFVNTVLSFLSSPIKVEVEARSRQDIEQVLIFCNRSSKVEYSVKIISKYKWLLRLCKKYGTPVLRINNSRNTSIAVDREEEYGDLIDCSNASRYIDIHLSKFPESDKIYFTIAIQSNKTIKWDDTIKTDFYIRKSIKRNGNTLFWHVIGSSVRIAHREEHL